jgi:hypothetical protein
MTRALSRSVSPEPQPQQEQDAEIKDPAAQEEEHQRRRLEEEHHLLHEMSPVRKTFENEAGPSEPQQEEVTPDLRVKGPMQKTTPKRTRK